MVVFDCDGNTPPDDPAKPTGRRKKQEADNKAVLALMDATGVDAFPADTLWRDNLVAWPTEIGDVVEAEIGTAELDRIKDEVRATRGIDLPNMEKNSLFIGYVMVQAWSEGKKSKTLEKLCDRILRFAVTAATTKTAAPVAVEEPVPV